MVSPDYPFLTVFLACFVMQSNAWAPQTFSVLSSSAVMQRQSRTSASFTQHRSSPNFGDAPMDGQEFFEGDEEDEGRLSDEELEASLTDWDDRIARFNSIHMTGRLGSDPVAKYFDDGKVVTNVSLASKGKYHYLDRKANGINSGDEGTIWVNLEIWGKTGEFAAKYADKGARVAVIGSLEIDSWSDKNTGAPRRASRVIVREFEILETKAEAEARRGQRRGPSFFTEGENNGGGNSNSGGGGDGFFSGGNDFIF